MRNSKTQTDNPRRDFIKEASILAAGAGLAAIGGGSPLAQAATIDEQEKKLLAGKTASLRAPPGA